MESKTDDSDSREMCVDTESSTTFIKLLIYYFDFLHFNSYYLLDLSTHIMHLMYESITYVQMLVVIQVSGWHGVL